MRKIRILHIIGSSGIGGAEKALRAILKYLDKERFDIFVSCPPGGFMINEYKRYAVELKTFDLKNWLNPMGVISLKQYIDQKKIDIVHTHLYSADFTGIIAAKLAKVPCIISTIHGHNFSDLTRFGLRAVKNMFFSLIYRFVYIFCDKVIAVCRALKEDLAARPGIKADRRKIEVLYNGFDLEPIGGLYHGLDEKIEGLINNGAKLVGTIGNLDRIKGHRVFLNAIPMVLKDRAKTRFLFVGSGEEEYRLRQLAGRLGIEKDVVFMGAQPDVTAIINRCDLIVLPSLNEGLPLAVLEAMALAKPVIATNVGGVPEIVEDGTTGLLVPPGDNEKMSVSILRLLGNPDLASEMGKKGEKRVRSLRSGDMVKKLEDIYLKIFKKRT